MIQEPIAWDAAVALAEATLAAWRKSLPLLCAGRCGRVAPMSLSFDATEGYPYRLAIDWAISEPGWMTVHGEKGERTLYCQACKPARFARVGDLAMKKPPEPGTIRP